MLFYLLPVKLIGLLDSYGKGMILGTESVLVK